jgi:uncharacterized 2Fe-2S/4Fe-4S cluster protein (DUF4445 family)
MPTVRIEPDGLAIEVAAGDTLLSAIARAGVIIEAPCGGRGGCGKCAVRVLSGKVPPTERGRASLSPERLAEGWRLACQVPVDSDMTVEVPAERRIRGERILTAGAAEFGQLSPRVLQLDVTVPEPSLGDQRSDLDRLLAAAGGRLDGCEPVLAFLRELPGAARAEGGRVSVTACRGTGSGCGRLLGVRPASRRARLLGASFDIGTTTVVGELWDLAGGRRLAVASRTNPQRECGDDVVSRSDYGARGPSELRRLQEMICGALGDIVSDCLAAAGAEASEVCEMVAAGNTVMTHLLLGVTTEHIARSPFAPCFTRVREAEAAALGLAAAPGARLAVMPAISGYVGGDITAGLLATRLLDEPAGPVLFIDVGTNGEIVLVNGGKALACSAAAGPAFEGARISHGCRAMSGAIEEVRFDGSDLVSITIDSAPARGICGTGLIDAAAALARLGLLEDSGRLLSPGEEPPGVPAAVRERLRQGAGGPEILLGDERSVPLTGRDLRELQLAKAAVRAGAETLLAEAGLAAADLERIVLAGAFGSYIDREGALAIGLLPQVPPDRVTFAGNTSAAGARLALLDAGLRRRADEIAREVRYLELSGRPDFQDRFAEAMFFPGAGG